VKTAAGKSQALIATTTHPFWVVSERAWIKAGALTPGVKLRTASGATVEITGSRQYEERQRTHDLTVTGIHAYYVLVGATSVLVHNCETTTICRTSPNERGSSELDEGLNPERFPRSDDGSFDGAAHFGDEKTATEWARGYTSGGQLRLSARGSDLEMARVRRRSGPA